MTNAVLSFRLIFLCFAVINYATTNSSFANSRDISCPNFGKRTKNFYLNSSIFMTSTVELEVRCLYQCVVEDQCLSYNYGPNSAGDGFTCELSGTDRFSGRDNFVSKIGFSHRGLVTRCERNPCQNGGTCVPSNSGKGFECLCPAKHYGGTCEKYCIIFDFEQGRLSGWLKTGTAFDTQPTYGDNPTARGRTGQPSNHTGDWWIGTFENRPSASAPVGQQGDAPQGTLMSPVFTIKGDKISFLIGGGCSFQKARAELVVRDKVVAKATGECTESMKKEIWNVTAFVGKKAQLRLIDNSSRSWGHINFDHLFDETC